jgi:outer membrane lipoprotein SlyB
MNDACQEHSGWAQANQPIRASTTKPSGDLDCRRLAEENSKKERIMFKKITLGAAAAVAAVTAIPAAAEAQGRNGYYDSRYAQSYDQGYYRDRTSRNRNYYRGDRRCSGTTGTIVGGAAGALAGRAIDSRGSRTTGTIIGAVAGALLGREVGKSTCRR